MATAMTATENLGPAERIIQAILTHNDHLYHGRPGIITPDGRATVGVRWQPVTHKVEGDQKVVYRLDKIGKKSTKVRVGTLRQDNKVVDGRAAPLAEYRGAGLFPEVATWLYRQVAEVWKLDNEFAAHWASYAFAQEHRDLKVVLAAFMLVQGRKGDPVIDAGKIAFHDADYRDVGEAMMLIHRKDDKGLNPKLLLRIHDVLRVPAIAQINRELGFGKSARHPFLGRWTTTVEKWLRYREENPRVLEGLVKAGFRTTVMALAQRVRYKPVSPRFFELLRWKQVQAEDGRRTMVIGQAVTAAETWEGLNETAICLKIVETKPDWKRIVGLLPKNVGVTRAIMACAIEHGCLSNKDLIIVTPTLEELGLLDVADVKVRWEKAVKGAEDMRAANIARNVKTTAVKEKLQEAADIAVQKAVEAVTRNMRIYFMVDTSGSMTTAIDYAKEYIAKFLQGFPPDRVHVATFNTMGREITIRHPSAAGVTNAFAGITASGGTDYSAGLRVLQKYKPTVDEDAIFIFVGDEEQHGTFENAVRMSGINPLAFGLLKIIANTGAAGWHAAQYGTDRNMIVRETARRLGIPCFMIAPESFADPYAIPRTISRLIASTPVDTTAVRATPTARVTLVDQIAKTELLTKPTWAA